MENTLEKVKTIIEETLKPKKGTVISTNTRFVEDLEADSIDLFLLVDNITRDFDIEINPEVASSIKTVGDVVRALESIK